MQPELGSRFYLKLLNYCLETDSKKVQ